MRIVVVGAGKLGYSIAELLSNEQMDVVVVDHDEDRLEVVKNTLDVLTVPANEYDFLYFGKKTRNLLYGRTY